MRRQAVPCHRYCVEEPLELLVLPFFCVVSVLGGTVASGLVLGVPAPEPDMPPEADPEALPLTPPLDPLPLGLELLELLELPGAVLGLGGTLELLLELPGLVGLDGAVDLEEEPDDDPVRLSRSQAVTDSASATAAATVSNWGFNMGKVSFGLMSSGRDIV